MNISSEFSPTNESISSSYTLFKVTVGDPVFYMYLIICVTSVLLGLPTNSYVLYLTIRGTGTGLASELFNLNLSVSEILLCLSSLFSLFSYKSEILRKIEGFLIVLGIFSRPLFQCLICVERYLGVVHPVTFLMYKSLTYRTVCSVIVWVASFGSCLAITLTSFKEDVLSLFLLGLLLLSLLVQLFCCLAVLRALKQSVPGQREEENHMKRRAFRLILITTVTVIIIHVPYIISLLPPVQKAQNKMLLCISYGCFDLAGLVLPLFFLYRRGKLSCFKCQ